MTAPIRWFDELDSTNAEARRRAEAGQPGSVWIAARAQTQGRGRRGRAWQTGADNLAATLLTPTEKTTAESAGVSFVASLAVADLARAYAPPQLVRLKWPNDVLLGGGKLSGILVETGPGWLAVGIGVNLASAPLDPERPAAALSDQGDPPTPEAALGRLAAAMDRWLAVWAQGGLAPVLDAWRAQSTGLPGPCTVRLAKETLQGEAEGLDSDGALLLRLADGRLHRVTAGDVFLGSP